MSRRIAAAILAGGEGRRLGGVAKPLLSIDGRSILERQLEVLRPLFEPIVIVANDPLPYLALVAPDGANVVSDRARWGAPPQGPLVALDAALAWARERSDVGAIVCVAGDMPFLVPGVLRLLRDAYPAAVAVVPCTARGLEPLCARYGLELAQPVSDALAAGVRAMHRFVAGLPARLVNEAELRPLDPDLRGFHNVNAPEDLTTARDGESTTPR